MVYQLVKVGLSHKIYIFMKLFPSNYVSENEVSLDKSKALCCHLKSLNDFGSVLWAHYLVKNDCFIGFWC